MNYVGLVSIMIKSSEAEGKEFEIKFDIMDNLVNGMLLGDDADSCYLPIFSNEQTASSNRDTWFIGAKLIEPYYFVLDMTPYDE
jgi:hypothetical protein